MVRRWWPTAAEIADDIRHELGNGDDIMAIRMLMDGVNQLPDAYAAGQLDATLAEPPSTGDLRWDTLLAAAIRYRLHRMGLHPPRWTFKEPLPTFWWPIKGNMWKVHRDMANTPAELLRVGIYMHERGFESA